MEELQINYESVPKSKKIIYLLIGGYLALFTLYFCITEGIANQFNVLFFCALIGFVFSAILILYNTVWLPKAGLKINNESIDISLNSENNVCMEWTDVSKVNIGISYILFLISGGKKQRRVDLSSLKYEDLKTVKSKVIELCEHKNIPFHND